MRFMVIVPATKEADEAAKIPAASELAAMDKFNEQLVEAGVWLAGEGLRATSLGARVTFGGGPAEALGADLAGDVRRLKATGDRDLLVAGSSTLVPVLVEQRLVDEVVLAVYPLLLGSGKRCFSERLDPRELELVSSSATPTGVLLDHYRYVGAQRTEA
jgi:hypothetical protein